MSKKDCKVEYRGIQGFPGYRVGNDGSVWSSIGKGHTRPGNEWKPLKQLSDKDGYCQVTLWIKGKGFTKKVHRLVLEAFVGPCPAGHECRHLDDDRKHNDLKNICWGTRGENRDDAVNHGRCAFGPRNGMSKLSSSEIVTIRKMRKSGVPRWIVASGFEVHPEHISAIMNGHRHNSKSQRNAQRAIK
jgi:hypothetical protein